MAAGNSVIGALRVVLGLDSAQFESGLKRSQTKVSNFSNVASLAFKAVGIAAAAAGAVMGIAAVRGAINHADALSKSAQKAGVTTEALSRLAYAASFSDVSMEDLTGSLGKLSKAMADATVTKTSQSALAFKALGIQVTDAKGRLRSADDVFSDLSDAFSRMADGSTKTALAMQIFGRSGAALIPLLNGGAGELKRMANEADRLGITLSTKTGRGAERFNDTLALVGQVLQGVTNKVMEAALPALQGLAEMLSSARFQQAAIGFGTLIIQIATGIADAIIGAWNAAKDFFDWLNDRASTGSRGVAEVTKDLRETEAILARLKKPGNGGGLFHTDAGQATIDSQTRAVAKLRAELAALSDPSKFDVGATFRKIASTDTYDSVDAMKKALTGGGGSLDNFFDPVILGAGSAKKAIEITIPPLTEMQQAIHDVGDAFDNAVSGALSGLVSDVIKGENAFDGLIGKVGQLGDQLVQMAMDQAIKGLFQNLIGGLFGGGAGLGGGAIGRGTYGGTGGFFPAFPSFAGGGFTGVGSRSGGVDGRGGFPALLHPNETVVDHTRGQGAGPVMNFNITGSRQDATEIARIARQEAMGVFQQMQKNPYRR